METELELCRIWRTLNEDEIDKTRPYNDSDFVEMVLIPAEMVERVLVQPSNDEPGYPKFVYIMDRKFSPSTAIANAISKYATISPEETSVHLDWNPDKYQRQIELIGHDGRKYFAQRGKNASGQEWLDGLRWVK
jgi:hypothetical protein